MKKYKSSSLKKSIIYQLGSVENDACGNFGSFTSESVRGSKILNKFLELDFKNVLDIGAGSLEHSLIMSNSNKIVDICDYGNSIYYEKKEENINLRNSFIGDFNKINFNEKYDAIWCCHILEHQLNPNLFLIKINSILKEDGYLGIVVPIRKPHIVGGHVSLWNAGLLLYHLVLANFDCTEFCKILQNDYNIGKIIKKKKNR